MKRRLLLALVGLAISFALPTFAQQKESTSTESTPAATPTPTLREHDTQVLPDRRVTFRLLAPKANAIKVVIGVKSGVYEGQGTTVTDMTKQADGFWTTTLGPFEPNLYEYQFDVDGVMLPDPGNEMPKPQRHVNTSLLLIPGTPPDFLDDQTGAHGTVRDETYYSTALGKNRHVLIYTPPAYGRSSTPLPVLYLYHGFFDTRYSWVTEGIRGRRKPTGTHLASDQVVEKHLNGGQILFSRLGGVHRCDSTQIRYGFRLFSSWIRAMLIGFVCSCSQHGESLS
jgi:hypothetical protein